MNTPAISYLTLQQKELLEKVDTALDLKPVKGSKPGRLSYPQHAREFLCHPQSLIRISRAIQLEKIENFYIVVQINDQILEAIWYALCTGKTWPEYDYLCNPC